MMMNDQLRKSCRLFQGIDTSIFTQLLNDAQAFEKTYKEGSYLYTYGDELNHIGIVLDGVVQIIKRDYLGNITILGHFSTYDLFGESFAFSSQKLQVDIYAEQDCHILWLPIKQLLALPQKSDEYQIILKNLMMILSNKNLYLTRRIDVISQRSTKEKLLTYLYQQKHHHDSTKSPTTCGLFMCRPQCIILCAQPNEKRRNIRLPKESISSFTILSFLLFLSIILTYEKLMEPLYCDNTNDNDT